MFEACKIGIRQRWSVVLLVGVLYVEIRSYLFVFLACFCFLRVCFFHVFYPFG